MTYNPHTKLQLKWGNSKLPYAERMRLFEIHMTRDFYEICLKLDLM